MCNRTLYVSITLSIGFQLSPVTCARSLGLQHSFYWMQQTVFLRLFTSGNAILPIRSQRSQTIFNNRFLPFAISFQLQFNLSTAIRIKTINGYLLSITSSNYLKRIYYLHSNYLQTVYYLHYNYLKTIHDLHS